MKWYVIQVPHIAFEPLEMLAESKEDALKLLYDGEFMPNDGLRKGMKGMRLLGLREAFPPTCRCERGKLPEPDYTFIVEESDDRSE